MEEFNISVSRIEMIAPAGGDQEVCITFKFERPPIDFQVPIFLKHSDFDDTEMVRAARTRCIAFSWIWPTSVRAGV